MTGHTAPEQAPKSELYRHTFRSIDAMSEAVRRARPNRSWQANQLSAGLGSGRVAALITPTTRLTATEILGDVEVKASDEILAFGINIGTSGQLRQWDRPADRGMVLLYTPGAEHRGTYFQAASYISMDIDAGMLFAEALTAGFPIDETMVATSRLLAGRLDSRSVGWLARIARRLHHGRLPTLPPGMRLESLILAKLLPMMAFSETPRLRQGAAEATRIVSRARAFIETEIAEPIPVDDICRAAGCSRSALYRAFETCLGESPQNYVLKLRLNRVREDLASPSEAVRTVTIVSHRWGITELGRLANRYRAQFGELPSETLARRLRVASDRHPR